MIAATLLLPLLPSLAALQEEGDGAPPPPAAEEAEAGAPVGDPVRGAAGLRALLVAAGGLAHAEGAEEGGVPVLAAAPGLRLDALERLWSGGARRGESHWKVRKLVPRLVWSAAEDGGYVYSEYARVTQPGVPVKPEYRRDVFDGVVSWSEIDGDQYVRIEEAALYARNLVRREVFLARIPHSLAEAESFDWVDEQDLDGRSIDVYAVVLSTPVVPIHHELVRGFYLFVDRATGLPLELQFTLTGRDKVAQRLPSVTGRVEFLDWMPVPLPEALRADLAGRVAAGAPDGAGAAVVPERLLVPRHRRAYAEFGREEIEVELRDPVLEAIEPAGFERPWLTGVVYDPPVRCDAYDPPAADAPAPAGGG